MTQFTTIFKDGRYQTLNEQSMPIDKLWKAHCCLICATKLYENERTFCSRCKQARSGENVQLLLQKADEAE